MTDSQADRTQALLRQLARGEAVTDALFAPGRVLIVLARKDAQRPQAQLTFSFAVNLLARLYPVVQQLDVVLPERMPLAAPLPRWTAGTLNEHLSHLLNGLGPPVHWRVHHDPPGLGDCALVVGAGTTVGVPTVFVGSDGWQVAVSPGSPQTVGSSVNPVGAYAAACFGVSEVWKRLLHRHRGLFEGTPILPLDEGLHFSALTYRACPDEPNPALPDALALDRLTVVGLGAGGGAAAFTLATLPRVAGILNLVEPDVVEPSNLNRYVFADAHDADRRRPKTTVARDLFARFPDLTVPKFPIPFGDAVGQLGIADFRYVLAAVHSREARRDIQQETPMVLWDAAAEEGDFAIWRMILRQTECMWCKHPPDARDPERDKADQLAKLLGFDAATWLRKVRNNEPFAADEVAALRRPSGSDFDLPAVGQRFGDWDAAQCGRLLFPAVDASVPVPFAPVMAGVFLAGEIIKEHAFPDFVLDSYYWNTMMGRFMRRSVARRRAPREACRLCSDPIYRAQYKRRWQTARD